jgi:hypothetical protein
MKEEIDMIDLDYLKETFWRNRTAIVLLVIIAICIYIIPQEARMGLLGLFTTKLMGVTLGILIAHFTRLFLFPYLELSKLIAEHHWPGVIFLAGWYYVIVYCFAMGG